MAESTDTTPKTSTKTKSKVNPTKSKQTGKRKKKATEKDENGEFGIVKVKAVAGNKARPCVALFERYKRGDRTWYEVNFTNEDTDKVHEVEHSPLVQQRIRQGVLVLA